MTNRKALISLIKSLRPVETDKKLIRMGPEGDGGYLLPDDFSGVTLLISPGVDTQSKFEWECAQLGMEVHLIDASVKGPAMDHHKFHFHPLFLGLGQNEISLENFIRKYYLSQIEGDWLLQMDIEGAEWEIMLQMPEELIQRFRIMVIEFHDMDNLFNMPFFETFRKIFQKILKTHQVVHIHPNNASRSPEILGIEIPKYMEFTFFRKDRINFQKPAQNFPHAFDRDCTVNDSYPLPEIWYGEINYQ